MTENANVTRSINRLEEKLTMSARRRQTLFVVGFSFASDGETIYMVVEDPTHSP